MREAAEPVERARGQNQGDKEEPGSDDPKVVHLHTPSWGRRHAGRRPIARAGPQPMRLATFSQFTRLFRKFSR